MPTPLITRKPHEAGYALLMVFLIAATIAIGLYAVAPRVAFESQRAQEQLLVDRGEQYKRAIQLYYRKFRKYPVKMDDLENTQNIRFLRKRYVDPMTGKNEWRLIHIGPGGQFTDSLTQKNNNTKKQDPASVNTFIAEFKSVPDPTADSPDQLSPALRRRPSDQPGAPGSDGAGLVPPTDPNNPAIDPNLNAGAFPPGGAFPGTAPGSGFPGDTTGIAANPSGYVPGGEMPLGMQQQLQQLQDNGSAAASGSGSGVGVIQPMQTFPQSAANGPAAIQQLLTSPRPGGPPPGIFNPGGRPMNDYGFVDGNGNNIPSPSNPQPVQLQGSSNSYGTNPSGGNAFGGANANGGPNANGGAFGGNAFGNNSTLNGQAVTPSSGTSGGNFATGSFAGVASTLERHGIKKYADRNKYNEWEFIYDYSKDVAKASGLAVNTNGANTNSPGANGQNPFGNSAIGGNGLNGASGTNGSSNTSGFGTTGGSTLGGSPNSIPPNPNATTN